MSRGNVEIVQAGIDAFNRKDWDAVFKDMAPDLEFDNSRAVGPTRGVYGLDQTRAVLNEVVDMWDSAQLEPHEFIEAGDEVVVPWTFHTVGRDGIDVQARVTWSFTIRDEAIQRICMYQERQDALEAAGLSE
jgi:ketosteroid isomerase-like protein